MQNTVLPTIKSRGKCCERCMLDFPFTHNLLWWCFGLYFKVVPRHEAQKYQRGSLYFATLALKGNIRSFHLDGDSEVSQSVF